ncbi:MAG: hypothetical protein JWP13_5 [Candidatus Saccharibacteria bacterium]|nr:hypothetical protein [Candidatus Saccharibacteria bacterium]
MGWDRVRYFNSADGESTLITGDKNCKRAVYDQDFKNFAWCIGLKARDIVDIPELSNSEYLQGRVNNGTLNISPIPDRVRNYNDYRWPDIEYAVEVRPPINDQTTEMITRWFESHCECNDAGMIIDNRQDPARSVGGF